MRARVRPETNVPLIALADGERMPMLGLGVFAMDDATTEAAVLAALEAGYRSIDTAAVYRNEAAVGRAIAASGVPRAELFVTTKLWNTAHAPTRAALDACRASLDTLGLDSLDLYLVHWPNSAAQTHVFAWEGLVMAREAGLTRSIGVSNFRENHLDDLLSAGLPTPVVNQIERHPLHARPGVLAEHARRGIVTEAWSPLARNLLSDNPVASSIARHHGVSTSQVLLRWNIQSGVAVIPKSKSAARIAENLAVFDFNLTVDDMAALDALDSETMTDPSLLRFQ